MFKNLLKKQLKKAEKTPNSKTKDSAVKAGTAADQPAPPAEKEIAPAGEGRNS